MRPNPGTLGPGGDMFDDLAYALFIGRFLKLRPRIAKIGGRLVARSSFQAQMLSLFAACRRVEVDPRLRVLRLRRRLFWLFSRSRRIEFDWILNVTYEYSEVAPTSSFAMAYTTSELFTVGLLLKNGEEILLFRFFGSGYFVNDSLLPDWMFWQDELDARLMHGNQEEEAQVFSRTVAALIGVPVRSPM